MATSSDAYVDTSALIAFTNRADAYHALFYRLFAKPPRLITSALVIAEAQAWFLRNSNPTHALRLLALTEDIRPLKVAAVGMDELQAGTRMLRRFADQDLTMTDAVGLHLMQLLRIRVCWSTDFHLSLTGVPLVIY